MGVNYSPKIATDGLVLCLDAGNKKSYPGAGTTWYDISGKGDAILNGPTFSSDNGGSMIFDGTNDYGEINDNSDFLFGTGSFTEEAWHKANVDATWKAPIFRGLEASWGGLWIDPSGNFHPYHYSETGSAQTFDTGVAVGTDWIHHVTTTTNTGSAVTIKVYTNGALRATQSTTVSGWQPKNTSVGTNLQVGGASGSSFLIDGRIVICRIYKGKALSATEVKENFNAQRRRFGL